MVWEGEAPPEPTPRSQQVLRCWNMLHNGNGAVDWGGLELACEMFEVDDVEALVEGLLIVKGHRPPKDEAGE